MHCTSSNTNTPTMSLHALQRVDERLVGDEAQAVIKSVRIACSKYSSKSLGIVAHSIGQQRGTAWGQKSNGDLVIVIVRDGKVKTIYLRRSTQSFDLGMFRTDVAVDMTGKAFTGVLRNRTSSTPSTRPTMRTLPNGRRVAVDRPSNPFAKN
tara:strand:+ start:28113 stop:28568 length:456 start_codon:yes stop_codon:yes gene_type:complete